MKISICCPSYKRPRDVKTKFYLPFVKIYVDFSEEDEYKKFNEGIIIIACPKGVQGNVSRIRNYILKQEFDNGADVVVLVDDDLKEMGYWEKGKKKKIETDDFIDFVEKHSVLASDIGAKFWGVNVNTDKQVYREYSPFSTLCFVGGPFQAFMKGNECFYDERLFLKEDYDMTIQQINKYRVVLRCNKFFYDCKQSENKGGCAIQRNFDREKLQLELLQKKWGKDIVRNDTNDRCHKTKKKKTKIDYNPVIKIPIKGI